MKTTPPTTLNEVIYNFQFRDKDRIALMFKRNSNWEKWTWQQYFENIQDCSLGLTELGVEKGDRVAIYSNTRVEWCICDYAIMSSQAVTVPIYQTVTAEDLQHILNNSEAKVIFIEDRRLLKVYDTVKARCPSVKKVVLLERDHHTKGERTDLLTFNELLLFGKKRKVTVTHEFVDRLKLSQPDDIASLIYTSGTTGLPKGVVLTHRQAISEISEAFPYAGVTHRDVALTFLPYAHILGRVEHWGQSYIGYTLAFAESIELLKNNLLEIRPTIMVSVPRIFEKIYSGIKTQIDTNQVKSKLFRWATQIGRQVAELKLNRTPLPLKLLAEYEVAKRLVLNQVKNAFGGQLRFAISGGAPLSKDIALFFLACDVLILEGYGLTETTAAICVNTPFDYRFGSVGKPVGDVKIRIADDGEVLVKSDKVMKEYYKDPDSTAQTIVDGWFHTGDIGEIMPSGDLRLTDRKKDLIKTAGGKYVAPQKIENLLKVHNIISHSLIHGDQKKYIVALLTLDKGALLKFAKDQQIKFEDYLTLTQHPKTIEMIRKAVAETNSHLASYESIKKFTVLPQDFTVEAGELTPSLKVKRKILDKKFSKEIQALYQ